jgi:hypothetical protein
VRFNSRCLTFRGAQFAGSPAFTLVEVTVLTAILGLLITLALPNFVRNREEAQCQLCIHNLNQIDVAKVNWAIHTGVGADAEPFEDELAPFFASGHMPACPAGGEYDPGLVSEPTLCTMAEAGHISEAAYETYGDEPPGTDPDRPKPRRPVPGRRPNR